MDTDEIVKSFSELNLTAMKEVLRKMNNKIPARKERIKMTGKREVLKAAFREYLEQNPAALKAAGEALAGDGAASGAGSSVARGAISTPAAADMLAAIMVPRTCKTALTTMECLKALQSPDLSTHIPTLSLNNLTGPLKPLLKFSLTLGAIYTTKQIEELSDDPAVNYEGLRVELLKLMPEVKCHEALRSFFESMGVKVRVADAVPRNDSTEPVSEVALTEQIHIVWNAVNRLLMLWRKKFPRKPIRSMQWPVDFTDEEVLEARNYVYEVLEADSTKVDGLDGTGHNKIVSDLMDDAPMECIKRQPVMDAIFRDVCRQLKRRIADADKTKIGGPRRSQSPTKKDVRDGEEVAEGAAKRKRGLDNDSDKEQDGGKVARTSRGRSRGSRARGGRGFGPRGGRSSGNRGKAPVIDDTESEEDEPVVLLSDSE